jgi:hypothetical protein
MTPVHVPTESPSSSTSFPMTARCGHQVWKSEKWSLQNAPRPLPPAIGATQPFIMFVSVMEHPFGTGSAPFPTLPLMPKTSSSWVPSWRKEVINTRVSLPPLKVTCLAPSGLQFSEESVRESSCSYSMCQGYHAWIQLETFQQSSKSFVSEKT